VLEKTGAKLGFMSAFTRTCVLAMKDTPTVNASIEWPGGGDTIVYRDYVDISVAVSTPKGLVAPVVRNAESIYDSGRTSYCRTWEEGSRQ
jgi:2-oxoglutarate dehydrogenase E2 component (dihydrolipoamide succinyltransferase)